jgi:hypothetical protein
MNRVHQGPSGRVSSYCTFCGKDHPAAVCPHTHAGQFGADASVLHLLRQQRAPHEILPQDRDGRRQSSPRAERNLPGLMTLRTLKPRLRAVSTIRYMHCQLPRSSASGAAPSRRIASGIRSPRI